VVVGKIVTGNGKSPVNARVLFIPSDYDPQTGDFGSDVVIDSVDSNGNYQFIAPQPVTYNLQAMWGNDGSRLLIEGIRPTKDSVTTVHTDTLRKPGTLKVMAPDSSDRTNGYLYVPGTTIAASLLNHPGLIELDSIPTGTLPVIYYSAKNLVAPRPVRYNIVIDSGKTTFIYYSSWTRSRRIFLNTSVSGAGTAGNVS
jgi:hypothetical protein